MDRWRDLTRSPGVVEFPPKRLNLLVQLAYTFGEIREPFGEQLGRRVLGRPRDLAGICWMRWWSRVLHCSQAATVFGGTDIRVRRSARQR